MTVQQLIDKLQLIENKNLEVKVLPDPDLLIDDEICAYGRIDEIEELQLYLDMNSPFCDGGMYKEYDSLIESNEHNLEEEFEVEQIIDIPVYKLQKWAEEHEKLHAVIITLKV
jgi:hypothetical protein